MDSKSSRAKIRLASAALFFAAFCRMAVAQGDANLSAPGLAPFPQASAASSTLFQNVRIFNGRSAALSAPSNVLVKGNIIERISSDPIPVDATVTVIAANGHTLMPGLIDAHWHAMLIRTSPAQAIAGDVGFNNIAAGVEATDTLMRGFTTVRDVGGPVFGLKSAIDSGLIAGLRIFPSGGYDHGDRRPRGFPPVV